MKIVKERGIFRTINIQAIAKSFSLDIGSDIDINASYRLLRAKYRQ